MSTTILIVDDEPHIRHVLDIKLSKAGHRIIAATDGEEGFELAQEHRPDLIISDFQMPRLNGLELCKKLREQEGTRLIPIVLLTARGLLLDESQLENTSVVDVLAKPFSPRELLNRVENVLAAARAAGGART